MYSAVCASIFGPRLVLKVCAIVWVGPGVTSLTGYIISEYLLNIIGYFWFFMISVAFSIVALALILFVFNEKKFE